MVKLQVEYSIYSYGLTLADIQNYQCQHNGVTKDNKLVLMFQDFLAKWTMVYPMPFGPAVLSQILVEGVIPFFGVGD